MGLSSFGFSDSLYRIRQASERLMMICASGDMVLASLRMSCKAARMASNSFIVVGLLVEFSCWFFHAVCLAYIRIIALKEKDFKFLWNFGNCVGFSSVVGFGNFTFALIWMDVELVKHLIKFEINEPSK